MVIPLEYKWALPDHVWLLVLEFLSPPDRARFALACKHFYDIHTSGAKALSGSIITFGNSKIKNLHEKESLSTLMNEIKIEWQRRPGFNRLVMPCVKEWTLQDIHDELDRIQIGVRTLELHLASWRIPYHLGNSQTDDNHITLDEKSIIKDCRRKGAGCITKILLMGQFGTYKRETTLDIFNMFTGLKDLHVSRVCLARASVDQILAFNFAKRSIRSLTLTGLYGFQRMPELEYIIKHGKELIALIFQEIEMSSDLILSLPEKCPKLRILELMTCSSDGFLDNLGKPRLASRIKEKLASCHVNVGTEVYDLFADYRAS
eukprot:m.15470 g.15470  ORF g.15470 m.15470 type:complete len:318 (+) comp5412_c0_seq2:388-1341(+)